MGAGYGVYVYQGHTRQAAFVDSPTRGGVAYSYKVDSLTNNQMQPLGAARIVMPLKAKAVQAPVIPSAAESSVNTEPLTNIAIIPAPTPLPRDALLLGLMSDTSYTDAFNTLNVMGEVRNDSNVDVGDLAVTVSFYNAAGSFINEATTRTMVKNLAPGERAPFILSLPRPAEMSNYSIKAVGRPVPTQLGPQIAVINSTAYEDDTGFYHVRGAVQNKGSVAVSRPKVVVTLYNRGGGIVNVGFTYPVPARLEPTQRATFDVVFTYFPKVLNHRVVIANN